MGALALQEIIMSFFSDIFRNLANGGHGRRGHGQSSPSGHHGGRESGNPYGGAGARGGQPCRSCGAPFLPGANFCARCGAAPAAARVCSGCSTALVPGARFCAKCGKATT
ncbi:double zinc ribbon domain-containing protein [Variovorax paradoxus]|uniref:double zinc ribbon domain-containing protein n=1 Tax=Variovorax paradoxus TaxID=34073 RepID=UPI0038D1E726